MGRRGKDLGGIIGKKQKPAKIKASSPEDGDDMNRSAINASAFTSSLSQTYKNQDLILLGIRAPEDEGRERVPYMFYPNDTIKVMFWDLIVSIILLITCFITPFNLAFQKEVEVIGWYIRMNYAIDILFAIDILVSFNSAYQSDEYKTVDDRKVIAKQYLKGWFLIDFLAIAPFDLIIHFMA